MITLSLSLSLPEFLDYYSSIFFWIEIEAQNQNSSLSNRFEMDDVPMSSIVEWNKKRKLQIDQLDLLRPKHKCWVRSFPSEQQASILDQNLRSERMHDPPVKGKPDASVLDDRASPVSAEDSNSFTEDSDVSMSVNEEAKLEADSANSFLYGRPSNSVVNWEGYNVKELTTTIGKMNSSEEDIFTDREYNQSYHEADIQALQNLEEQILGYEKLKDDLYSEYAKENCEDSMDKGFEDLLYSSGVNPNMYVLSSGRWQVNPEAQSSIRPPTIDQEFEQYFSMLML